MTEVQSALIAPITKLLRIKHFLWYAHTSKSVYLRWCHFWLTGIITSTPGSCPISGSKVFPIGQGIDSNLFSVLPLRAKFNRNNFVHFGRFDPSKNLKEILTTCKTLRARGFDIKFKQIGSASTLEYQLDAENLREAFNQQSWITFSPSIPRSLIPAELKSHSAFIHAYSGSLDKTLVEATMQGLPVITINPEYIKIFGSWSGHPGPGLLKESETFLRADVALIQAEVDRRRAIAVTNHGLLNWTKSISILFD
jgi:glycosyltransferase involved in cell wall biosynthesis